MPSAASPTKPKSSDINTAPLEPSNPHSKAPIIDDEGFITPHPKRESKPTSSKSTNADPASRGKFPPKPPSSNIQSQTGESGNSRPRHERRGPGGETRIGSLYSKVKKAPRKAAAVASSIQTVPIPSTTSSKDVTDSTSAAPVAAPSPPAAPTPNHDEDPPVHPTPTTTDPRHGHGLEISNSNSTEKKEKQKKKYRPIILWDENNRLSWADEVIEEAEEERERVESGGGVQAGQGGGQAQPLLKSKAKSKHGAAAAPTTAKLASDSKGKPTPKGEGECTTTKSKRDPGCKDIRANQKQDKHTKQDKNDKQTRLHSQYHYRGPNRFAVLGRGC